MAVAYFTQWPAGGPAETSTRVAEQVNAALQGRPPEGGIYHAEGPTEDGGWWTFNVWESAEARQAFTQQILQPALDAANASSGDVRQLQVTWDSSQMRGGS
jgi:hypothetical protein